MQLDILWFLWLLPISLAKPIVYSYRFAFIWTAILRFRFVPKSSVFVTLKRPRTQLTVWKRLECCFLNIRWSLRCYWQHTSIQILLSQYPVSRKYGATFIFFSKTLAKPILIIRFLLHSEMNCKKDGIKSTTSNLLPHYLTKSECSTVQHSKIIQ